MARRLSDEEMDHYRRPFADPGESRRPTLSWPRNIPIEGKPPTSCRWSTTTAPWLAESDVPKLLVSAEPRAFVRRRIRDVIRSWPNLTETTVSGLHFVQENSPDQIGTAVAQFVRKLRALAPTAREFASGHHPVGRTRIHPSERQ
jgi:haloalkane dehalogenase